MARHRRGVLLGWLALLAASAALLPIFASRLSSPDYAVGGSESRQVSSLLARYFPDRGSEQDVVVFDSPSLTVGDPAYRRAVASVLGSLTERQGVARVTSPYSSATPLVVSADRHSALAILALSGDQAQRYSVAAELQGTVERAAQRTRSVGVDAWLTGYSPISNALNTVEGSDLRRAESIGIPVAFLILLLVLGTLSAAMMTLLTAFAGLLLTFGMLALVSFALPLDAFVETFATMIGVGIGIDYSLFVVSRFREELARQRPSATSAGDDVAIALGSSLRTSGRTIFFSGVIVAISLASLFTIRSRAFQEVAVATIVVVAATLAAALTLLPAVLAVLGERVNAIPLPSRIQPPETHPRPGERPSGWARWAHLVMGHPWPALLASASVLVAALIPVFGIRYGIDLGTASLAGTDAGKGAQTLAGAFTPGALAPVEVLVTGPGYAPLEYSQAIQVPTIESELRVDNSVSQVFTQTESRRALLTVVPTVPVDSPAAAGLVDHIRNQIAPRAAAHGTQVLVGGATAEFVDLSRETQAKFPLVIALVLGVSLLFLLLVFRSVLLPIKAVALNLLVTGAALGLVVVVFQQGVGEGILGFTSSGFIQVYLPVSVFALLFGLSMDYEVFLVRRIREGWEETGDNLRAVAGGIQHTARPISGAALIMVTVFGSFMIANVLEVKQFGFALAVAILLDATLVRLVLVPALMRLLGARNWWLPAGLDRHLPRIGIDQREPEL